ncbi:MAG: DUF1848 domain-containing protein [Ruminococcaceae bacterium]|nr:DUF1848 domain-containing protein [Oscillospiraceae bacterium]
MILSASRRTDIPGHYAEWFLTRMREGYALTRNPMNHAQLYRVPLTPDLLDAIVFWTKDPAPMLPHLPQLDQYGIPYLFQFTLTPYGKSLEPGLREKTAILRTFQELSREIGKDRVLWRYDPIILNDSMDIRWHREAFTRYCDALAAYTARVTISFLDLYPKLRSPLLRAITAGEMTELSGMLSEIAGQFDLPIYACSEAMDLRPYGIAPAACIDRHVLEALCGCPLRIPRDPGQRKDCGCAASVDIGAYDTCTNGCVYCYANHGSAAAARRKAQHDPASPLLFGSVQSGETIIPRKVQSFREEQLTLF